MRQIWVDRAGKAGEVMAIRHAPVPRPREGEVRIRVRSIGLNFAEVMIRLGVMPNAPKLPLVLGWEVAGTVEVGAGDLAPGDRVFALTDWGGYSEVVCCPAQHVFRLPDGWTFEEGAAFSVSYLVAYQALWAMGSVRGGEQILVHGAAGAIGQAVAQLARIWGCTVYGTASASKHDRLRALGVTPIDYRAVDFVAEISRLTNGRGVDLVLDPIGGAHWKRSYAALAETGRLITYAMHQHVGVGSRSILRMVRAFFGAPRFSPITLLDDGKGVLGVNLGHLFSDPAFRTCRAWIDVLLGFAREGKIRPAVGHAFPFEEAAKAHDLLQAGRSAGKVVLQVASP
jgi:NADPH:quinone reductase-like Zn-dependent oxidoreductase